MLGLGADALAHEDPQAATPSRIDTAVKAALALVPYVGGALAILYEDVLARRRDRLDAFGAAAFDSHPEGWEGLLHRLRVDPRLAELFVQASEAAMTSTVQAKAQALGKVLADAATATDEDTFDHMELLALALMDLESPHLRGLQRLANFPTDDQLYSEHAEATGLVRDDGPTAVTLDNLMSQDERRKQRLQVQSLLPPPVVAALVRHGLVTQDAGFGLYITGVSDFGRDLLSYVASVAADTRGA